MSKTVQSVEPLIADLANGWLKSYKLDYKLEQESLNNEIDNALKEYESKSGGKGPNRPDAKLILQTKELKYYPILIEYKGYKDKLEKIDDEGKIENTKKDGTPNYSNIKTFAVNGAIHYSNAILHHTSYTDVIAIGMTGYKDSKGTLNYSIAAYYVSKENYGIGQKIGNYDDLSFLSQDNFDDFIKKVNLLRFNQEELELIKEKREKEIEKSLSKLNEDIYKNEKGLSEQDRVHLVAASIMATIGIPGKIAPLEKSELKSVNEKDNRDGDIIIRKIDAFLLEKKLPLEKKDLIIRSLKNTILAENLNKVVNGETQLKRIFIKIVDDLGYYYKIGLTTDFTGKLFNVMYSWLGFTQDKLNDVVLTPSYVANLLVKLARVNKDSYVWDFATGSAGLLVAAMNEMLNDAKNSIRSPKELAIKEANIKANQLLGLEILPSIYMLAILNMILMGDGSSNILNKDSLIDFDGKYGYSNKKKIFPADAFVLNPPYSAEGKGMIFVERALDMMDKGYAAIIIQDSAGNGKATDINCRILKKHTLLASIKMPDDLFVGKSKVKTYIYVFKVKERHEAEYRVKFINFSNDGYARAARGKSNSESNLKNIDHAKERYDEVVKLVKFGQSQLHYLKSSDFIEDTIDIPLEEGENYAGKDWNFGQHMTVDTSITQSFVDKTVSNKLLFKLKNILNQELKEENTDEENDDEVNLKEFLIGDLFEIYNTKSYNKNSLTFGNEYDYITRTSENEGVLQTTGLIDKETVNESGTWSLGLLQMDFFYRDRPWFAGQYVKKIKPKFDLDSDIALYFTAVLNTLKPMLLSWLVRDIDTVFLSQKILLPVNAKKEIDFDFIKKYEKDLESKRIKQIAEFLKNYN